MDKQKQIQTSTHTDIPEIPDVPDLTDLPDLTESGFEKTVPNPY